MLSIFGLYAATRLPLTLCEQTSIAVSTRCGRRSFLLEVSPPVLITVTCLLLAHGEARCGVSNQRVGNGAVPTLPRAYLWPLACHPSLMSTTSCRAPNRHAFPLAAVVAFGVQNGCWMGFVWCGELCEPAPIAPKKRQKHHRVAGHEPEREEAAVWANACNDTRAITVNSCPVQTNLQSFDGAHRDQKIILLSQTRPVLHC